MLKKEFLDNGIEIYQDDSLYCFTSDSILLSKFTKVKFNDTVADFCAGSGVVGFNLYALNKEAIKSVTLFELQKEMFDLNKKSIEENNLENKFFSVNCRLQDLPSEYHGKFSLITCNPPYMPKVTGLMEKNENIATAKTELKLSLEELITAIDKGLKFGGRVNIVHRADRLIEVICELKKHKIEPKKLQFVSAKNKEPYLFLMEAVKGGKSGLKVLNNLIN